MRNAIVASGLFCLGSLAQAQTPLGTTFTYQGQLKDGGAPANGAFNMQFTLWNDPNLAAPANQVGPILTFDGVGGDPPAVTVTDGLFTVGLDFGNVYSGNRTWLQVSVAGQTLSPRQELTAAPYARFAAGVISPLGVGTNTPESTLHVVKGSAGAITANSNAVITGENAANSYLNLLAPDANETGVLFGRPGNAQTSSAGGMIFNNASTPDGLQFRTGANTTRMALTSAGNLGVGTSAPAALVHVESGSSGATPNSNSLLVVERNTSTFINVLTPASQQNGILFGTPTNSADGGVVYNSSGARGMQFRTGGNVTRAVIDALGNFGIGNLVPLNMFSVSGSADIGGNLGLGTTTPASKLEVVPASDGDGIRMTGSSSAPVASPVVSFNDGPTQRCMVGLAEAAAEFSTDAGFGDMVIRSNATKLLLQTGTGASGIAITNNNIGLGTTAPAAKLDVRGDIKLGASGELFGMGGAEKLRVLRGRFNATTNAFTEGLGLTATHPATGQYVVSFATAFSAPPTITATSFSTGTATIATVDSFSASQVTIRTWTVAGAAVNTDFMLIVAGPR